jgi:hypothetical protein
MRNEKGTGRDDSGFPRRFHSSASPRLCASISPICVDLRNLRMIRLFLSAFVRGHLWLAFPFSSPDPAARSPFNLMRRRSTRLNGPAACGRRAAKMKNKWPTPFSRESAN